MKDFLQTRLIPLIALCSLSTPAVALVGGSPMGSQVTPITRQVEQRAGLLMERAIERRLEKQIEAQTAAARKPLEELPARLPILTHKGQKAFNDVILEDG